MDDSGSSSRKITLIGPTKQQTFLDGLCLFLMTLPFAAIWAGLSLGGKIFFLFPTGLETILPAGIIVLTIQVLTHKKRQFSVLSGIVLGISVAVINMGIFGWMLIIAVAG